MGWEGRDGGECCRPQGDPERPMSAEDEKEEPKSSICCLQGCLASTAVGFGFLVALPSGILLVIYSVNKSDVALLSVGAVLVALPILMLVVVIVLCFNQRRLARLRQNKITSTAFKVRGFFSTAPSVSDTVAATDTPSSSRSSASSSASSSGSQRATNSASTLASSADVTSNRSEETVDNADVKIEVSDDRVIEERPTGAQPLTAIEATKPTTTH